MPDKLHNTLAEWDACQPAMEMQEAAGDTLASMWTTLRRGDWLVWFADRAGVDVIPYLLRVVPVSYTHLTLPTN